MSDDGYRIVYADPPWRFEVRDRETGLGKSPDRHYRTMKTAEIAALPVGDYVADDAFLIMWVYDPMLPAALDVARAWGFSFVTVEFRWLKTTDNQLRLFEPGAKPGFSTGYHTRCGACEEAWLFKRGRGLKVLRHDIRREFYAPIREHSRKPDEVAGWIVDLYGDHWRVEMFARTKRSGWEAMGDEIGKYPAKDRAA
ncbi:MAG: DNA methyltransferase [Rhodospirillales bacterium]|nr:DNA methyltransferase [Rhodospirillales bacterium]